MEKWAGANYTPCLPSRKATAEGIVLLKNNNSLLPLAKGTKVEIFDAISLYYQNYVEEQYKNGAKIGLFKEAVVPEGLLREAKDFTDTAIIVIRRYSSEASDRKNDGTDD